MLNDFLSGKRSYVFLSLRVEKVDMEQRAKELEVKKARGKNEEKKRKG